jgi:hypothetical protein
MSSLNDSSCPALCRASTSFLSRSKTWMAGTSPAMTNKGLSAVDELIKSQLLAQLS